jgi:hypothetical protein
MDTENTERGTTYKFTGIDGGRYSIHISRENGKASAGVSHTDETTIYECSNKGENIVHKQVKTAYGVEVVVAVLHCPEEIMPESFMLMPFSTRTQK